MAKRINPKISEQAENFYREHFGAARKGATFVLDAFPHLVARTWKEIEATIPPDELAPLVKRLSEWDKGGGFAGLLALELSPHPLKLILYNMPAFSLILLELHAASTKEPIKPPPMIGKTQLSLSLTESAYDCLDKFFTNPGSGAAYVLESFPRWSRQALKAVSPSVWNRVRALQRFDQPEVPYMAGQTLPLRIQTQKQLGNLKEDWNFSAFTACAMEIEAMSSEKKVRKTTIAPKVSSTVAEALAETFGNTNQGGTLAVTCFARLYEQTLAEEVATVFSPKDLATLARDYKGHPLGEPTAVGDLILTLVEDRLDDLGAKVHTLTPFGRAVLEIELAKINAET